MDLVTAYGIQVGAWQEEEGEEEEEAGEGVGPSNPADPGAGARYDDEQAEKKRKQEKAAAADDVDVEMLRPLEGLSRLVAREKERDRSSPGLQLMRGPCVESMICLLHPKTAWIDTYDF